MRLVKPEQKDKEQLFDMQDELRTIIGLQKQKKKEEVRKQWQKNTLGNKQH